MIEMKMLNERLWNITGGKNGNFTLSHIHAKTAKEAITHFKNEPETIKKVESWPIYEGYIGLDYGNSMEQNDVIDITVHGTSKEKMDRLLKLIAMAIGGPFGSLLNENEDEEYDCDQAWLDLRKEFEKNDAMVNEF